MTMMKKIACTATVLLFISMTSGMALAIFYPESYLNESVDSEFFPDGTLLSESRGGHVSVLTKGVLQSVDIILDGDTGTNLLSRTAYRPAMACPEMEPVKLYLNTTESDQALSYRIDESVAPRINVSVRYGNSDGGEEIHSGENTVEFWVNLTYDNVSPERMEDVAFEIRFPTDTGPDGETDSFDISRLVCSPGTDKCTRINRGTDDETDSARWVGDLEGGKEINIMYIKAETDPRFNFPEAKTELDLDKGSYTATYSRGRTFTGIEFYDRIAKDSARNGIYMREAGSGNWLVKGFFKNKAEHLQYSVDGWKLYRVGNSTPKISEDNETLLDPGDTIYTDTFTSQEGDKNYYMSSFDWEVEWGGVGYTGSAESSVYMPKLLVINTWSDKSLTLLRNDLSGREIKVVQQVEHLGNENLTVNRTEIYSRIPHLSTDGTTTSWTVRNVSVSYTNSTSSYRLSRGLEIDTEDATTSSDGYVMVDLMTGNSSITGITQNEKVVLSYIIESGRKGSDENYNFTGNTTMWTESGTPEHGETQDTISIDGVKKEKPPFGGGAAPTPNRMELDPLKSSSKVITGNIVEVERADRVIDTGGKKMRRIEPQIFIPEGGELRRNSLEIIYREEGIWKELTSDMFEVKESGTRTVGGSEYTIYDVEILTEGLEGFTLGNDDVINITYEAEVNFGRNDIITRLSGYNYYEDSIFYSDATTPVRVGWKVEQLVLDKGIWRQKDAIVGSPVEWVRRMRIRNPNNVHLDRSFEITLPDDAFSCRVGNRSLEIRKKGGRKYVEWEVGVDGQEEKNYTMKAYTSPVMLSKEDIEVIESAETWVKFRLHNEFINYAPHMYRNVYRVLDIKEEKVQSVEMMGLDASYFGVGDSTKIDLGGFSANRRKSIDVVYKEFPPILIVTPDAYNYTKQGVANISILAVGKEDQTKGRIEIIVEGPMPEEKTVYSNIIPLGEDRVNEVTEPVDLSELPPGNYTVRVYFRKNFGEILSESTSFWVAERRNVIKIKDWYILVLLAIITAAIVVRVYRKKEKYKERMRKLRKKLRKSFK